MVDYHSQIVAALSTVLPVWHEMMLHSGIETPCISYMELSNTAATDPIGCSIGFSHITYQVKVWAQDIEALQRFSLEVDDALRPLGFKRIGCVELYDKNSSMMQKVMSYEGLARETLI